MVLTGARILSRNIITNLKCAKTQVQPCGIDLTLKTISTFESPGTIDFDNTRRKTSTTKIVPFLREEATNNSKTKDRGLFVNLAPGSYLLEFNEKIDTPLDVVGQLFPRSSLFRSGAWIIAGVMDSGYSGVIGATLKVDNPAGICLYRDARVAQMMFHEMSETAEGYCGEYQHRKEM